MRRAMTGTMTATMAGTVRTQADNVDRRQFINGRWSTRDVVPTEQGYEIASILVQTRPERLDAAAAAIAALPGTEIHGRDPKGKLVVVIEADGVGRIGATLATISSMPHVLTAALVFHGTTD
jgi:periplasmic nitrate reductase NapD